MRVRSRRVSGSVDEKPMQALARRHPIHADRRGVVRHEFEYRRRGTCSLLSAFDATKANEARIGYSKVRDTRLQLNASNLGDRTYVASCFSADGCYYGLKRSIYGTMRYRW